MSCMFHLERDVNEVLWYSVFGDSYPYGRDGNDFENDVFEVRPYDWFEENNDYHFYHKPSGLKIYWYKYPLRSPMSNMEITHEQFLIVLRDCFNSFHKNVKYDIEPWWEYYLLKDLTN